ncbi:hypothetical protein Tco_1503523 [Tanacetum coccineum]
MSDSDESGVTYTEVSSPFEGLSDIGSPRANDHEYLELPWMPEDPYMEAALQAPPSPDYVPGPEEPEQAPPSPDYVPGPEHADDEIVAEDQPYAEDASPTAQSPDYVPESDPEADPEEDDDEDPEEDPVDYPADGGDDGDDEDEPSEEDEDDELNKEAREDEGGEEHPLASHIRYLQYHTPVWTDAEVARLPRYIYSKPSSPHSPQGESSSAAARQKPDWRSIAADYGLFHYRDLRPHYRTGDMHYRTSYRTKKTKQGHNQGPTGGPAQLELKWHQNKPQGQHRSQQPQPQQQPPPHRSLMPNSGKIDKVVTAGHWQTLMQTKMAMNSHSSERVAEGLNALLKNALTKTL